MKLAQASIVSSPFFQALNYYFFSLKSTSYLVIPANYNPLITPLIIHPIGPAPIVNKVFKTKLNILSKITVKVF